jgi:hypothetical protein
MLRPLGDEIQPAFEVPMVTVPDAEPTDSGPPIGSAEHLQEGSFD